MITYFPWTPKPEGWEVLWSEWIEDSGWWEFAICDTSRDWDKEIFSIAIIPKHELRFMWE